MSHSIIIYPNGMVEVTAGYDNDSDEPVAYGVVDTKEAAEVDPVSDALDMLDEHFANHGVMRVHLQAIRAVHNLQVWGADVHNRQVWGADVTCKAAHPGV